MHLYSYPYESINAVATIQHEGKTQKYIGMTENTFKTRYTNHKASFKHRTHRKQTELSNLIWDLKDKNINYKLTWKIVTQAQPYKPGKITCNCNLCLCEKYNILINKNLINRKSELLNKCPQRRKYLTTSNHNFSLHTFICLLYFLYFMYIFSIFLVYTFFACLCIYACEFTCSISHSIYILIGV